jgi:hypothetical protein
VGKTAGRVGEGSWDETERREEKEMNRNDYGGGDGADKGERGGRDEVQKKI